MNAQANTVTLTTAEITVIITIITSVIGIAVYIMRMEIKNYVQSTVSDASKDQSKFRKEIYDKMDSDREKFTALMSRVDRDITTLQLTQNSTGEKMEALEKVVEKLDNKVDTLIAGNSDQTRLLHELISEVRKK